MKGDIEQLRAEMVEKVVRAIGGVEAKQHTQVQIAQAAVAAITEGWSATKNTDWFRDAGGMIHNGANLQGGIVGDESECVDVVVWHVGVPVRELTAEERAEREARSRWIYGDHSTPPPVDLSRGDLIRQATWWITKDKQVIRLEDMAPTHRANTLALLRRNATGFRDAEMWRWMTDDMPDDVSGSLMAEMSDGVEVRQKRAWKWLKRKPLVGRLRELVKADKLLAGSPVEG